MTGDSFKSYDLKTLSWPNPLSVKNGIISVYAKSIESCFVLAGTIYLRVIIHFCDVFVMYWFRIIKCSSIYIMQFGFVNILIALIGFILFTTCNVRYLRISVLDEVEFMCCMKWVANESDYRIVFEWMLCVHYINRVTPGAFYFIYYTLRPTFTSMDTFSVDFRCKRTVTLSIH